MTLVLLIKMRNKKIGHPPTTPNGCIMNGRSVDGGHQHHQSAGPDHRQQRLIQASFPVPSIAGGAVRGFR